MEVGYATRRVSRAARLKERAVYDQAASASECARPDLMASPCWWEGDLPDAYRPRRHNRLVAFAVATATAAAAVLATVMLVLG